MNNNAKTMENKEMMVWGQIYKTNNPNIFNNIITNREINISNYSKLLNSFKQQQLIIPILVNNKFEIIDGQHRVKVCTELELPIYFYIVPEYGSEQLAMAQISASWTTSDYLHSYIENDKEDYIWLNDFIEENGISITNAFKIIKAINNENINKIGFLFREGSLKIDINTRNNMEEFIDSLNDFSFFTQYKSGGFISAFIDLYYYPNYKHEIMKAKLKNRQSVLKKQSSKSEYLELLTEYIYSFKSSSNKIFYNSSQKEFYTLK